MLFQPQVLRMLGVDRQGATQGVPSPVQVPFSNSRSGQAKPNLGVTRIQ